MAERELTVEEFVKAVEMLARSLSISMQVLQEKANPILFKQALAVAVGTVVKDDELEDFIEEVREWSGSSVHLLREDEAHQAAIRDARFRHELNLRMPSRTSRAGIGAEESVDGIGTSSSSEGEGDGDGRQGDGRAHNRYRRTVLARIRYHARATDQARRRAHELH